MKNSTFMTFMGCCSTISAFIVAWTDVIIGNMAVFLSMLLLFNTLYCFITALKIAVKEEKKKYIRLNKTAVIFAENFHRMLEQEAEREFWKSKDA